MAAQTESSVDHGRGIEAINSFLVIILGFTSALLAIVAVVNSETMLAGIAGFCSLALAFVSIWQSVLRRSAESEVRRSHAEIERLQRVVESQSQPIDTDPSGAASSGVDVSGASATRAIEAARREPVLDDDTGGLNDPITGLLGEDYFVLTLHARVAYARRHLRPLSLILLDVVEGVGADLPPSHAHPVDVADIVATTLRDADTVCRLRQGRFGLILEDTNETGAIWTVERIRREINTEFAGLTVWAGVACYPAHGFDGPEVFNKATEAIESARDWFQDRTEVASI